MKSFAYGSAVPSRAFVFGEAERYALLCARVRCRRGRIESELSRLLDSDERAWLHASVHAYVTEWVAGLDQMLEALRFGKQVEADAVILRAQSALMRRWAKIDTDLTGTAGVSAHH